MNKKVLALIVVVLVACASVAAFMVASSIGSSPAAHWTSGFYCQRHK